MAGLEYVRTKVKTRKDEKKELEKVEKVLTGAEQRYAYETWEARRRLVDCRKDDDGYRIKANQQGRREWSRSRVNGLEKELRTYEVEPRAYDLDPTPEKRQARAEEADARVNPHERAWKGKSDQWGFWKQYEEGEEKALVVWKKGVLYKKKITKPTRTSWDRVTNRTEWYDRRRTMNLRRRWASEGRSSWRCPAEIKRDVEHRGWTPARVRTTRLDQKKERTGEKARRGRTYERFANPEERRNRDQEVDQVAEDPETFFQSRRRVQTARSGEEPRPAYVRNWSTREGKEDETRVGVWTTQLRWLDGRKRGEDRWMKNQMDTGGSGFRMTKRERVQRKSPKKRRKRK